MPGKKTTLPHLHQQMIFFQTNKYRPMSLCSSGPSGPPGHPGQEGARGPKGSAGKVQLAQIS